MKEINYTYIGYGPSDEEIIERDKNKKCVSVRFKNNGDTEFFCNTDVEPFQFSLIPSKDPIYVWIPQGMICKKCLNDLKNKYNIDFDKEIPCWCIQKGHLNWQSRWAQKEIPCWCIQKGALEYTKINPKDLPLVKELERLCKEHEYDDFVNPEVRWFKDVHFLYGVPIKWLREFEIVSCALKGSSSQGKHNGPDYIFKDKSNKTIGFEITSYKWNIHNSFKKMESAKKFAKNKIFNIHSFDEQIDELKQILKKKSEKKYSQTDELFLGIVVNNTLVDYEYYVLEIILNNWIKQENIKLDGVYIL